MCQDHPMTRSPAPPGTVLTVAPVQVRQDTAPRPATEVAAAAEDCARVGAAVVDLVPDAGLAETVAAVRERTSLLVRITAHARGETLTGLLDAGSHIISCPLSAPAEFAADLREGARERGIAVHHEARSPADLAALREVPAPTHVVLVFGAGLTGDVPGFAAALGQLPEGTSCTATGLGEAGVPVLLTALAAGAHVRTGMADHAGYAPGVRAKDDAQLAARAAGVAKIAQRPPLPPAQAAPILGVGTPGSGISGAGT